MVPAAPSCGVGDGEHERLDIALEERADAHRAGFLGGEDGRVREADGAELPGGLAKGDDDRVGRRVVRLEDPVMGADDHRLVDDGHRGVRPLAVREGGPCLGQRLAHEQLVVHDAMLADRFGPDRLASGRATPNRNRPGRPSR